VTVPLAEAAAEAAAAAVEAAAAAAQTDPAGNNGTVKIHEGADAPSPEVRNQPHVCTFHIYAHGFDAGQDLQLTVLSWPPTGDRSSVLDATLHTDDTGEGRWPESGAHSLPDGHYRLVVDTGNGVPTQDKHKMFWVKCTDADATTPDQSGTGDSNVGGADTGNGADNGSADASQGGTSDAAMSDVPAEASAAQSAGDSDEPADDALDDASLVASATGLATTGAGPIVLIAVAGFALVAAGVVLRRRRSSHSGS
jgi:hypothetical protein